MPEFEGRKREDLKNSKEYEEFKRAMKGMTNGEITRMMTSTTAEDDV